MSTLTPDALYFVLTVSLSQEELLKLVRDLDIVFPGTRPSQLPKVDLVDALTDEFFKARDAASSIGRTLDERLNPKADLSFLSSPKGYKAFKKMLHDICPGDMAAYLWRLSSEESPEARQALKAALKVWDKRLDEMEDAAAHEVMEKVVQRSKEADNLEKRLEEARHCERQKGKKVEDLLRRLDEMQKKLQRKEIDIKDAGDAARRLKVELDGKKSLEESAHEAETLKAELSRAGSEIAGLRLELSSAMEKLRRHGRLKRIGLFVDVQNLIITGRAEYGGSLDFKALLKKAEEGPESASRLVVEAYAYLAEDPLQEKTNLKNTLKELGFVVRTRPILYRADGTAKGNWDLGMAVEVLEKADRLDIVILGTGDGDFLDLVRHLKEKKPHLKVEIVCFDSPRHTSEMLIRAADHVHRLGPRQMLSPKVISRD